jgi:hypothetical protein
LPSQLRKEWAARKAKEAKKWEKYQADKAQKDEAKEKAKEEAHKRKHWIGMDGRPWAPPASRATARTSGANAGPSNSAKSSSPASPPKPHVRQNSTTPLAQTESDRDQRLRSSHSVPTDEEDKSETNSASGKEKDTSIDSDESTKKALDLVLGVGKWGTASPPSEPLPKPKRADEVCLLRNCFSYLKPMLTPLERMKPRARTKRAST